MGGYLVYFNGKLIGDICNNELFLKTPTSDTPACRFRTALSDEGSKTLMHVFDSFDDKALILELLDGMYV